MASQIMVKQRHMESRYKKYNQQATRIQTVKNAQKDVQKQQVTKIIVNNVQKRLRTMANQKSPGPGPNTCILAKETNQHA